jgi:DNA primase catalytic subunit
MKIKNIAMTVDGINGTLKDGVKPKIARKLSKVKRALINEYEDFQEASKQVLEKQKELYKTFAKKDEEGNPIIENGRIKPENETKLEAEMEKIIKPMQEELDEIGEKDIDVKLDYIKINDLSDNVSSENIDKIYFIIKD